MTPSGFQKALVWSLIVLLCVLLYLIFRPFLVALTWAVILATFCYPLYARLRNLLKRPNLAASVMVLGITLVLVCPTLWMGGVFINEMISTVRLLSSDESVEKARQLLDRHLETWPVATDPLWKTLKDAEQTIVKELARRSAALARNVASVLLDTFVMLFAVFYLLRDGPALAALLRDLSPLRGQRHERVMSKVTSMIEVVVSSMFLVAAAQGVLAALVFWVLGLPSPVFWGVLTLILAFLPVVGPWLVWAPVAVWLLLTGSVAKGVALLLLGLFIVSGADNVLRPLLIAGRAQLNGLLVFTSLLGGLAAFGFVGIALGPLLTGTAVGLLQGYRESLPLEGD